MAIVRHLMAHKAAMLLIVVLLFAQAACDLSIPALTSQIVDIGIQQSGVEHVTCEEMSPSTYGGISVRLSGTDEALFRESYDFEGGLYRLNEEGRRNIDRLDEVLARPLIEIHGGSSEDSSDSSAHPGSSSDPSRTNGPGAFAELSEDASSSLVNQQAIAATVSEYESIGYDLTGMRVSYLLRVGAAMAGLAALGMLIAIMVGFIAARTGARIGHDLRQRLFSNVVSFSEKEIGAFSAASLITRGTNDIQLIQMISIIFMRMVLFAPILAIGGIVMVLATSPSLGWLVAGAIVTVFVVVCILFKVTMPKFKVMQKLIDRVNLVAREMLSGMPVVRAFGRQEFEEVRFDKASAELMRTQLFTNRAMAFMMPTMTLVMNLTSVAIVWFGGFSVQDGSLQTGDLIAFITYAMVIIMGFLMLGMIAIMLPRANVAAQRVDEVISCKPSIVDPKNAVDASPRLHPMDADTDARSGKTKDAPDSSDDHEQPRVADNPMGYGSSPVGASVEFRDVDFCYDEDGECENVVKGVSFKVDPGETVAIIGPTGSGKSTILKLLMRFYDVDAGEVLVDGVDVRDMAQKDLRSQIGYAPQKPFLFSGTVATNVAYSDEGMPESRIREALEIAQASSFVSKKPEGEQYPISQGGSNVSGGQRQRLSIARAIAKDARLLLFDDSFSALDYKTDAELRRALRSRVQGVTCIIVAQRIATVMEADSIVVLEEGRIVGNGTHSELMRTCPNYREIALSQLSESELSLGGEAA